MRTASLVVMCAVVAVACKDKEQTAAQSIPASPPPHQQSAAEAMRILCNAYADSEAENANRPEQARVISDWVKRKVTNGEVLSLFASLDPLRTSHRYQVVASAATKYSVAPCPILAWMSPPLQIPEVSSGGLRDYDDDTWLILVSANGIGIEGKVIVAITDGAIDPDELETTRMGRTIPRLTKFLVAMQQDAGGRVSLAIDPSLSYGVLMTILLSAKQAKLDQVQMLVKRSVTVKQIPLRLVGAAPSTSSTAPAPSPDATPVRPVVSVSRGTLVLWSISGLEGTLRAPKLTLPVEGALDLAPLVRALEEIIERRNLSAATDRELIAMFEPTTSMQIVASVLAAARATDDKELFPALQLSVGFE